jgi:hypothetical protein
MKKMGNHRLDNVKDALRFLKKRHPNDQVTQKICDNALEDADAAAYLEYMKQQEAKMIGVRNPAFDGDMVGYPEDDIVDYYGLDEDEKKK